MLGHTGNLTRPTDEAERAGRLGTGAVFRQIFEVWREQARYLLVLAVLVFVPVGLAEAIPVEIDVNEVSPVQGVELFAFFLTELAIIFAGVIFYGGAAGSLMMERLRGRRTPLLSLLRQLPYGRLAALNFIVTLGFLLGFLLFVVPGVVFFTWFSLAMPAAGIEHRGVLSAMRRSRSLVRGRFSTVADSLFEPGIPASWLATTLTLTVAAPVHAMANVALLVGLSGTPLPPSRR